MERAVDLTQLFPATQQMKNGADIRLSVDVVEDLFRLPDITHVVIAAGDSDYIALAQRAKRLGRYIVGVGVAGGTSKSLRAACNEYADYDACRASGPPPTSPPRCDPHHPRRSRKVRRRRTRICRGGGRRTRGDGRYRDSHHPEGRQRPPRPRAATGPRDRRHRLGARIGAQAPDEAPRPGLQRESPRLCELLEVPEVTRQSRRARRLGAVAPRSTA